MYRILRTPMESMPWDDFDQVVFDIGNVLIAFQPENFLQTMFPDNPQLHQLLLSRVFHSPYWVMLDRCLVTPDEVVKKMAGPDEELLPAIHRAVFEWVNLIPAIPAGVDAMNACRAHGKGVYLLSNYNTDFFLATRKRFSFLQDVDGEVVSGFVHILKPDPRIYNLLIGRYHLNPDRTLFIDDSAANIEGAAAAGLAGYWCSSPDDLKAFFR